jgi:hypothetical protein
MGNEACATICGVSMGNLNLTLGKIVQLKNV